MAVYFWSCSFTTIASELSYKSSILIKIKWLPNNFIYKSFIYYFLTLLSGDIYFIMEMFRRFEDMNF